MSNFVIEKYISLLQLNVSASDYLFTAITYKKSPGGFKVCNASKPLSYTRSRYILLLDLSNIGLDGSQFSLHSLRSGVLLLLRTITFQIDYLKYMGVRLLIRLRMGILTTAFRKNSLVSMNLGI